MVAADESPLSEDIDSFRTRVREHGRWRAVLESFAYVRPFGGMFGKIVPLYASPSIRATTQSVLGRYQLRTAKYRRMRADSGITRLY